VQPEDRPAGHGRVVAVWGPLGAPGRTTVAVGVADEASRLGVSTLLVDADVYGGVVAQVLGLLDESPGLAGAARQASTGTLDGASLARLAWTLRPHLRVLTGLARADRWPELRPRAVTAVLDEARRLAELTVVDCSFCLEEDEELSFDTAAPRRNGATLAVLEAADTVLCVSGADPVALQRTVRALGELREVLPDVEPVVVINQVRRGPVPGDARTEIAEALERFAGRDVGFFLPADRRATDAALAAGRTLAEVAAGSPLRTALRSLASAVAGVPEPATGRRLRAGRRAG
jgi:Flp pilus assembly CpaE family ATPase